MPEYKIGQEVTIPAGAELNRGSSEDSSSIGELNKPTKAKIVGLAEGALQVEIDGISPPIFWHQPVPTLSK